MATGNFYTQKEFDLYATNVFEYDLLDENDEATGEYEFDEYYFDECKKYIEDELNEQLEFFDIDLESGYYDGVQTIVNEHNKIHCYDDVMYMLEHYDELDGKDIYADYGYNKYILKRKIEAEIDKINEKLLPQLAKLYGFDRLGIIARFSNGETIYGRY